MSITGIGNQPSVPSNQNAIAKLIQDPQKLLSQLGQDGIYPSDGQKTNAQSSQNENANPTGTTDSELANLLTSIANALQEPSGSQPSQGQNSGDTINAPKKVGAAPSKGATQKQKQGHKRAKSSAQSCMQKSAQSNPSSSPTHQSAGTAQSATKQAPQIPSANVQKLANTGTTASTTQSGPSTQGTTTTQNPATPATSSTAPTSSETPSSTLDQQNGPISLANASVRADKVGTNYISNSMLQSAEANGGQLKNTSQYDSFIDANAGKFGLDPAVVKREYRVESGGDPSHLGDTNRSASEGGPSMGLLQVSQGLLSGGVWAHPGIETSSGTQLTTSDLQNNPEVQLLAGMQHLADYKNEAAASLGSGASADAIYTKALGNYVGHDQSSYINNIEKTSV